jgi:hypothetical protein
MDFGLGVIDTLLAIAALGLVAYVFYRLLRWARGRTKGAHVLGAVLTEVTQGVIVSEAKKGKKRDQGHAGDPPNEE